MAEVIYVVKIKCEVPDDDVMFDDPSLLINDWIYLTEEYEQETSILCAFTEDYGYENPKEMEDFRKRCGGI